MMQHILPVLGSMKIALVLWRAFFIKACQRVGLVMLASCYLLNMHRRLKKPDDHFYCAYTGDAIARSGAPRSKQHMQQTVDTLVKLAQDAKP